MDPLLGCAMFPPIARKDVPSLYSASKKKTIKIISEVCERDRLQSNDVFKMRKYIRSNLPAVIITDILSEMIPSDKWRFPCSSSKEILECRIHSECSLVFGSLGNIISVLFSEDISKVKINLKTVKINSYSRVVNSFIFEFRRKSNFLLSSLVLCGGSVHTDSLVRDMEDLMGTMKRSCPNLENLHLPVTSNIVLNHLSQMKIKAFKSDRTKGFNKTGLYHLCRPGSHSHRHLQVLHLGVFKHSRFEKQDVAEFVRCMKSLREFSLLDSARALVRLEASNTPGDKVLTYSVFKLAIRDSGGGRGGRERLVTSWTEMTVVDRSLKPFYILESAPHLERLSLDWQQELSFPDWNRFRPDWFSVMVRSDQSWALLARRLSRLDITFPATYSINSYSLPLEDFTRLMENLGNLVELRLVGAGQGGPIPLMPILHFCPRLTDLRLERSPVHVPDNYEVIDRRFVSSSLQRFYYLGEMSSLLVHNYMTTGIAIYMPNLVELEVRNMQLEIFLVLSMI